MRKLPLLLLVLPFIANSQSITKLPTVKNNNIVAAVNERIFPTEKIQAFSPVRNPIEMDFSKRVTRGTRSLDFVLIGQSLYGLQTNSSIARRIKLYNDGRVSATWTTSPSPGNLWTNRGTGYNHFDGSSWITPPVETRIETDRVGWPNLGMINKNSTDVEYVIAHFASAGGNGGFHFNINDAIGSSNWTETTKEKLTGPIWYRTAESGKYIYSIGTYFENYVMNGVSTPTVYYRYDVDQGIWINNNELLPGYDTLTKKPYDPNLAVRGVADEYAIEAKDSIVAILIAIYLDDVVLWKSYDYGNTWDITIIDTYVQPQPAFYGDTIYHTYCDGTVSLIIDDEGYCHAFWGNVLGFRFDEYDDQYWANNAWGGQIKYFNEKDAIITDTTIISDTILIDTTTYRLFVDGANPNSISYMNDTSWNYSYLGYYITDTAALRLTVDAQIVDSVSFMNDTSWNYTFNINDSTVSASSKSTIQIILYNDSQNPYAPTDTLVKWPMYYTYTFDTLLGTPTDSALVTPDSTIYQDSFIVETINYNVSKKAKKSIQIILYNDINNPLIATDTLNVWPVYYSYNYDTINGSPTDSTLYKADSSISQSNFTFQFEKINTSYIYKKDYPNYGFLPATMWDRNGNGVTDVEQGAYAWREDNGTRYYGKYGGTSLTTFPSATIDENGNIFLIYSSIVEEAYCDYCSEYFENYRDVYVIYSTDGGYNWSEPQNITDNLVAEDVFASVAREVDDYIHIIFQEDDNPGTEAQNFDDPTINYLYYVKVPTSDIIGNLIGPGSGIGIAELKNELFYISNVFPNPFSDETNIQIYLNSNTSLDISILNVVGQTIMEMNYSDLRAGDHQIAIDGSTLKSGIYFLKVTAGNYSETQKLIVE